MRDALGEAQHVLRLADTALAPQPVQRGLFPKPVKTRLPRKRQQPTEQPRQESPGQLPLFTPQKKRITDVLADWQKHREQGYQDTPEYFDPTEFQDNLNQNDPRFQDLLGWGQKMEDALYDEFMEWWPTSDAAKRRKPQIVPTNWRAHPQEPVTHWLNVEDFLAERYPEAATGSKFGYEDASPALTGTMMDPDEAEMLGYSPGGNIVTQVALNLHNKMQGRGWASRNDQRRYFDMMMKTVGPNGKPITPEMRKRLQYSMIHQADQGELFNPNDYSYTPPDRGRIVFRTTQDYDVDPNYQDASGGLFPEPKKVRPKKEPEQKALFDIPEEKVPSTSPFPTSGMGGYRWADSFEVENMKKNLLDKFHASNDDVRHWGTQWYDTASDYVNNLADVTGLSSEQVAGVMAAFSPRTSWDKNTALATHFLLNYDPNNPDSIKNFPGLKANLDRAKRIMAGPGDYESVLAALGNDAEAPKIRSFYKNMMGDKDAVTIDAWMARAIMGKGHDMADKDLAAQSLSWAGAYDKMSEAVRQAAKELNISPRELQAIIWTHVNPTADYREMTPETYKKMTEKREKLWTKSPPKTVPDYTHGPGWNLQNDKGDYIIPQPQLTNTINYRGGALGQALRLAQFALAYADSPKKRDSGDNNYLHTRIPKIDFRDEISDEEDPIIEKFQEFLDAPLSPMPPEEILREYLTSYRPEERINVDKLEDYIGKEIPHDWTGKVYHSQGITPWGVITYPPGFKHSPDDPPAGAYFDELRQARIALRLAMFALSLGDDPKKVR